jgi:hypothetical protein
MDTPPAGPSTSANVLDNTGTAVPQGTPDPTGPAQTPQADDPYPPIASDLLRVLGSLPQRQENGYYVRGTVLSWRTELDAEIVRIIIIFIILSLIFN